MNVSAVIKPPASRIPKVGEAWTTRGNPGTIYLRVSDEYGSRALGHKPLDNVFYAVDLTSGRIRYTPTATETIILEPVGGTAKFQIKES